MTRSDAEALDEVQLSLSRACEELLASDAWQRAPSESFGGLKKRLRMIPGSGLPEMRVVANATLEKLGRIPRSKRYLSPSISLSRSRRSVIACCTHEAQYRGTDARQP